MSMQTMDYGTTVRLVRGLGWFSIALGAAELIAPGPLSRMIGTRRYDRTVRAYGAREIAAGVGLLLARDPAPWLWGRVAGDALDLGSLGAAAATSRVDGNRLALATAAVVGVMLVDLAAALSLTSRRR